MPSNQEIAEILDEVARLLERNGQGEFRVRAYRRAAEVARASGRSLEELLRERGTAGLQELPGIGPKLARAVEEIVDTGHLVQLERLRAEQDPERLLQQVPGLGRALAARLHRELGVSSLEELELAAHDGRLEQLRGFGPKLIHGVQSALAGMLSRSATRAAAQRRRGATEADMPPIALLLATDERYRQRASRGDLPTIAPRRFNPSGEAWLPVLRARRDGWRLTALFSNTAQAHKLGKTRDWVVIYAGRDGEERQQTVVTASSGELEGRRVVRGREEECRRHYQH